MADTSYLRRVVESRPQAWTPGRSSAGVLAPLNRNLPARLHLLAVAADVQRQRDPSPDAAELIPVTAPELLRLLRRTRLARVLPATTIDRAGAAAQCRKAAMFWATSDIVDASL